MGRSEPSRHAGGLTRREYQALLRSRLEDARHLTREASGTQPQHCGEPMEHAGDGIYGCINCNCITDTNPK